MNRYTALFKKVLLYEQTPGKFAVETVTHAQCYPESVKWDCGFAEEYIAKAVPGKLKAI